ncbi:hypothetical protein [Actinomadura bangladeshensis]|uniref:DUF3558 domain-containing protein n=1 Tax=Actinomadura bangladeshensis TaxID=453573 RepID=A0A4R4NUU6_9ACTN|nr:hypothetical protein [Actinomadura bangladeshensis]TDC11873.1 hypothetical protein E1284_26415 [Actinomadura bangladeshensis]
MSGSHRSGSDRDSYRGSGDGQGPGGGYRPDGGGYGTGRDEYEPYPGRDSGSTSGTSGYEPGKYGTGSYETGKYSTGGYETGKYGTGGYETGGYGSGGHPSGQSGSGPYQRDGGLYQRDSGPYQQPGSGQYPPEPGSYERESAPYRREASPYQRGDDPYQRDSGPYRRETGPYQAGSGGYRSESGGYGTDTGGYRTGGGGRRTGSGGYRSDTGGYRTGSHRVARERGGGRRWGVILGGIVAGIGVCVLAVVVILGGVGASGDKDGGDIVGSGAAESSPTAKGERALVPDSCTIVGQDLIDRLAPGSERTQADNYQSSERQNQCVWGAYAGDTKRQLTVELRAIAGSADETPTDTATKTFTSERSADESGKALLPGQKLTDKLRLKDVGDDGYIVYSVDGKQGAGEAVGNIRLANVLITIHYSGSDDGDPLSSKAATDGTTEVAKAVIEALNQG